MKGKWEISNWTKGKGELRKKLARKGSNEVQNSWVGYHTSLIFINLCIGKEIMIFYSMVSETLRNW
jgi:hypothetical protein